MVDHKIERELDRFLNNCYGFGEQPVPLEEWKLNLGPMLLEAGPEAMKTLDVFIGTLQEMAIRTCGGRERAKTYSDAGWMLGGLYQSLDKQRQICDLVKLLDNAIVLAGMIFSDDKSKVEALESLRQNAKLQLEKVREAQLEGIRNQNAEKKDEKAQQDKNLSEMTAAAAKEMKPQKKDITHSPQASQQKKQELKR